jgi:HTH-like domain
MGCPATAKDRGTESLLRREGWRVNRKRTYRVYRDAGLAVRRRKRKRIGSRNAARCRSR